LAFIGPPSVSPVGWNVYFWRLPAMHLNLCAAPREEKFTTAANPRNEWSAADRVLGRGRRARVAYGADELVHYFVDMVNRIHSTISGLSPPSVPTPGFVHRFRVNDAN
jgi:hypothetical protein